MKARFILFLHFYISICFAQFDKEIIISREFPSSPFIYLNNDFIFLDNDNIYAYSVEPDSTLKDVTIYADGKLYDYLVAIDLENDGIKEFLAYKYNSSTMDLYKKENHSYRIFKQINGGTSKFSGVIVDDYDGDGWDDIGTGFSLLLNNKNNDFTHKFRYGIEGFLNIRTSAFYDINNDGIKDVLRCTNHLIGVEITSDGNAKSIGLSHLGSGQSTIPWFSKLRIEGQEIIVYHDTNVDSLRMITHDGSKVGFINLIKYESTSTFLPLVADLNGDNNDELILNITNNLLILKHNKLDQSFSIVSHPNSSTKGVFNKREDGKDILGLMSHSSIRFVSFTDSFQIKGENFVRQGLGDIFYAPRFLDMDGDGLIDAIVRTGLNLYIVKNLNNFTFAPWLPIEYRYQLGYIDMDSDGDMDFYDPSEKEWKENLGNLIFSDWKQYDKLPDLPGPAPVSLINRIENPIDLNGDGIIDYIIFEGMTGENRVSNIYRDIDGDGDIDVFICNDEGSNSFGWYRNDGNLTFKYFNLRKETPVLNWRLDDIVNCVFYDFNHDGFPDMFLTSKYYGQGKFSGVISLYLGSADGLKFEKLLLSTDEADIEMLVTDLDNDKIPDYIFHTFEGIYHFRAHEKKIGGLKLIYDEYQLNRVVHAIDFNGDGNTDLINMCRNCYAKTFSTNNRIVIIPNNGDFLPARKPLKMNVFLNNGQEILTLPNAKIIITDSLQKIYQFFTDDDGRFEYDLPDGTYNIKFEPNHFEDLAEIEGHFEESLVIKNGFQNSPIKLMLKQIKPCSSLSASVLFLSTNPCDNNAKGVLNYANLGTHAAFGAKFNLKLPATVLNINAPYPLIYDQQSHSISIAIDTIAFSERGSYPFSFEMPCVDTTWFNLPFEITIVSDDDCNTYHLPKTYYLNTSSKYNALTSLSKFTSEYGDMENNDELRYQIVLESDDVTNVQNIRLEFSFFNFNNPKIDLNTKDEHFYSHPCKRWYEGSKLIVVFDSLNFSNRSMLDNVLYFYFNQKYTGIDSMDVFDVSLSTYINNKPYKNYYTANWFNWTTIVDSNTEIEFNSIRIFPNPTHGLLHIENFSAQSLHYEISDLSGRTLIKIDNNHQPNIDISSFPNGVYILHAQLGDHRFSKKIVKF